MGDVVGGVVGDVVGGDAGGGRRSDSGAIFGQAIARESMKAPAGDYVAKQVENGRDTDHHLEDH